MPISITDYFNFNKNIFIKFGAFDAILDIDTRLFIDPSLLKHTTAIELVNSHQKIEKAFKDVILLLSQSKSKDDRCWKVARKIFSFHEIKSLCIGYSSKNTSGSGMGFGLTDNILTCAKEIIEIGITEPEIFELVGILEEGIGADRISDMVANIILDDLIAYSKSVFKSCEFKKNVTFETSTGLPLNPFNDSSIILIPTDILRDLPVASSYREISHVCMVNEELRYRFNAMVSNIFGDTKGVKKRHLKKFLLSEPDQFKELIKNYKNSKPNYYNYEEDRAGQVIWYAEAKKAVNEYPLKLILPDSPSIYDVYNVVLKICDHFKCLIENNGLFKLLYDK